MNLTITNRAADRLRQVAEQEGLDFGTTYLRLAVKPGGCSGLTYDLGWDTAFQESDETTDIMGIRVVMDLKSRLYMDGTELDFSDGLEGKGFHFSNPNAQRTCACGESFGL